MTDEELLFFASKACSFNIIKINGISYRDLIHWNPLAYNNQAFELLCDLEFFTDFVDCKAWAGDGRRNFMSELVNGDKCAAMRRAIVIAAAEIGKEMESNNDK